MESGERQEWALRHGLVVLLFVICQQASRRTLSAGLLFGYAPIVTLHVIAIQLFCWQGWKEISMRIVGV